MNTSSTVGLMVTLKDNFTAAFQKLQKSMLLTLAEAAGAWYALGKAVDTVTSSFNNQYTAILQMQSVSSQLGYNATQLTGFAESFNGSAVTIQEGAQLISQSLQSMLNPSQIQSLIGPGGPLYKLAAVGKGAGQSVTQAMMGVMQGLNSGSLGALGQLTGLQNTKGFAIQKMVIESLLASPFTRAIGMQKAMELIQQSAGKIGSQFDSWNHSLEGAQEKLNATWENAKAQIGQAIAPLLERLVTYMTKLVLMGAAFVKQHPEWVKWGAIVIAAAATAILTIVAALSVISGMLPVAVALAAAMALVVTHLQTITDMIQGVYQLVTKGSLQASLHDRLQTAGTLGAVSTTASIAHGTIGAATSVYDFLKHPIKNTEAWLDKNYQDNVNAGNVDSVVAVDPASAKAIGQAVADSLRASPLKASVDHHAITRSTTWGAAMDSIAAGKSAPFPAGLP